MLQGEKQPAPHESVLPTGTVTFLFTDIEGSTRLWQGRREVMPAVIAKHDALLRQAVEVEEGVVFGTGGDGVYAAFADAPRAVSAAIAGQRAITSQTWPEGIKIRVRMALHTGLVVVQTGTYAGHTLNRVARLLSAGHGGQVLLSLPTAELVRDFLPPGAQLRDLGERRLKDLLHPEHIYELTVADLPQRSLPLKTLDARNNNLPQETTPFIGRRQDIDEIARRLHDGVRLLTLTGVGGTGKTRLALAAATRLRDEFEHGVCFVSLAALADPGLVMPAIARALGIKESGDQVLRDQVIAFLSSRQFLLVLDNCEHVLQGVKVLADFLLACPRLVLLATSRSRLHLAAEYEYPVAPLQIPGEDRMVPGDQSDVTELERYDAIAFFVDRVQAANGNFRLTPDNAAAVVKICRRLDGLPLALELAAARLRLFPPPVLLTRLSRSLDVLRGGPRDAPARQQTLRGTIDWSFELLPASEKRLFARLAVFAGGFSLESAEILAHAVDANEGEVVDGLESLIDKSLLRLREDSGEEARFVMLQTIREYGLEQLTAGGEANSARHAHAVQYLELAEEAKSHLMNSDRALYARQLSLEIDNLRAALQYALEVRDTETGLRLAGALWPFWEMHGHLSEGREWLRSLFEAGGGSAEVNGEVVKDTTRAAALIGGAALSMDQSDYAPAREQASEGLELYRKLGDRSGIALALNVLGSVASYTGDYVEAETLTEQGLALYRQLRDMWGIGLSLNNLGALAADRGNLDRARTLYEEGLRIEQELGADWAVSVVQCNLGDLSREFGDYESALRMYARSLELRRALGDVLGIAHCLAGMAAAWADRGEYDRAEQLYRESLQQYQAAGARWGEAHYLEGLAGIALARGHMDHAVTLYGAAAAMRDTIGHPLTESERATQAAQLDSIRGEVGGECYNSAWRRGWAAPQEALATQTAAKIPVHTYD